MNLPTPLADHFVSEKTINFRILPCEEIPIFLYPVVLATILSLKQTSIPRKIDTNVVEAVNAPSRRAKRLLI